MRALVTNARKSGQGTASDQLVQCNIMGLHSTARRRRADEILVGSLLGIYSRQHLHVTAQWRTGW